MLPSAALSPRGRAGHEQIGYEGMGDAALRLARHAADAIAPLVGLRVSRLVMGAAAGVLLGLLFTGLIVGFLWILRTTLAHRGRLKLYTRDDSEPAPAAAPAADSTERGKAQSTAPASASDSDDEEAAIPAGGNRSDSGSEDGDANRDLDATLKKNRRRVRKEEL